MDRSLKPTEWQPQAIVGNYRQVEAPLMAAVQQLHLLPARIAQEATFNGCLVAAAQHSGMDDFEIAERLHISAGYMSRFMRGVAQQWAKRLVAFMRITQSLAPLQWLAHQMGCDLVVRTAMSAELAAAHARVRELERQTWSPT